MIEISVIVPVFNEASNIKQFLTRTTKILKKIGKNYEIIFCLDPSNDNTEKIILDEISQNENIKLIVFSRRFGQPAATIAGIANCKGNHCVIIDVDLQDPPEVIEEMYSKIISEDLDVVYAKRKSRKGETLIKKIISKVGYAVINKLSDINIPIDVGDFRIISRKMINELIKLSESHGFLRGLVSFVGFKQSYILYDREERYSGAGNYNKFFGSFKIGINGIVSFSSKPLFIISLFGLIFVTFSLVFFLWYLFRKTLGTNFNSELSFIIILLAFFSGTQLLGLGLLGEYIGRIYDETKKRPKYIIDRKVNFKN